MKTFSIRRLPIVFVSLAAMVGLAASVAGCGADASNLATASRDLDSTARRSQPTPQDPPPPSPSTIEECAACHGLWEVHGIEPVESCVCKVDDEGRDCTDGDDCKGECLLADDAEFHVMDQGDPPRGYYQGHCAPYDTTFGCFRHVPPGIQTEVPLAAEEAGPYVCVD